MDLSLPGMDGWEATRRLKADERTAAHPGRGADRPCAGGHVRRGARRRAATRSSPSRACRTIWSPRSSGMLDVAHRADAEERAGAAQHAEDQRSSRSREPATGMAEAAREVAGQARARRTAGGEAARKPAAQRRGATAAPAAKPAARAAAEARAPSTSAGARRARARPSVPTSRRERRQPRASTSTASSESTEPLQFGPIGIGAEPAEVYTVHYKDMAAVVSDAPLEVLDSTRENVLAHERVNETVMREHTVIPMSFGTIFKTREDIVELLRSAYDAFGDVLNKMQDKLEFGLKVLWDRDQIDPRDRGRGRGHPPAEERDLRRRRARPTSRACSTAG